MSEMGSEQNTEIRIITDHNHWYKGGKRGDCNGEHRESHLIQGASVFWSCYDKVPQAI